MRTEKTCHVFNVVMARENGTLVHADLSTEIENPASSTHRNRIGRLVDDETETLFVQAQP